MKCKLVENLVFRIKILRLNGRFNALNEKLANCVYEWFRMFVCVCVLCKLNWTMMEYGLSYSYNQRAWILLMHFYSWKIAIDVYELDVFVQTKTVYWANAEWNEQK